VAKTRLKVGEHEIARRIQNILLAIRSPEHADDIIELRRIVRKQVPFYFRSYFAAYLLKDMLETGRRGPSSARPKADESRGREDNGREKPQTVRKSRETQPAKGSSPRGGQGLQERSAGDARPGREQARGQEARRQERQPPLPEGIESATLFVSAGRKRHFYPRHILEMMEEAGIANSSVGEIRLFDNYTFVQIAAEAAETAIAKLDGASFKGRRLSVKYARKREESSENETRAVPAEEAGEPSPQSSEGQDSSTDGTGAEERDFTRQGGCSAGSADGWDGESRDEDDLGPGSLEDEGFADDADPGEIDASDGDSYEDEGADGRLGQGGEPGA